MKKAFSELTTNSCTCFRNSSNTTNTGTEVIVQTGRFQIGALAKETSYSSTSSGPPVYRNANNGPYRCPFPWPVGRRKWRQQPTSPTATLMGWRHSHRFLSCRSNLQALAGSVRVVPGWLWLHNQASSRSVGPALHRASSRYPRQQRVTSAPFG